MAFTCNIQSVVHCGKFQHEAKMYLSKQQQSTQTGCSHYCRLFSIWTIRKTHDFQAYFSRTFQDLKKSFNFQNFPGSKWFYRTFQVLEFSGKKFQDFTGGVRTLQNASTCKLLFPAYIFHCHLNPKIRNLHLCHTMHRWRKIDEPDRQWRSSSFQESKSVHIMWPLTLILSTPSMHADLESIVSKFGRDAAICRWEEAIFVPAQKRSYHVTFDLDLEHILHALHADLESCESLVAIQPYVCEKKRFAQKFTDGRTDDGHLAIALAHSWNELKTKTNSESMLKGILKRTSHQHRLQWHCKYIPYNQFNCHIVRDNIIFRANSNKHIVFQCWQSSQYHIIRIVSLLPEK